MRQASGALRGISTTVAACLLAGLVHAGEPLSVVVTTAERTPTARTLSLTGELAAPETLSASFPTGGRISEVAVEDGDAVKAGAVLARIDRVQQEQALRSAEAQLDAAKAEYVTARDDEQRQTELFSRGATTRAARAAAADRLAAAAARRAQAEAALAQAVDALADTVLLAPEDATVIERLVEPGQVVGAAQPVIELAQGQGFEAVFEVPEAVLTGTPDPRPVVTLSPIDTPDVSVTGHVSEVSPLVNAASGTVTVRVALQDPLPGLSYGDAVRGRTVQEDGSHVTLPWSAISATADGPAVWIVDPDSHSVSLRQVDVARYTSDSVLLSDGVQAGEVVVSLGAQLLYPGRVVRLAEDPR